MKCTPLKFQKGDKVSTPKGRGFVTAVGALRNEDGAFIGLVYRVGRNQYWHGWQLKGSK